MAIPAAVAAAPMAGEALKAATDLAKSVTGQVTMALKTPLFSWEETTTRTTRRGYQEIHRSMALPAWVLVGGAVVLLLFSSPPWSGWTTTRSGQPSAWTVFTHPDLRPGPG